MLLSTETYMPLSNNCDEEAIRLIAEAGFDALDYSMFGMRKDDHFLNTCDYEAYARQLKEKINAAGLVCNQAHAAFHFEGEGDLKRIQRVEKAVKIAGILGASTICVHPVPFSRDPKETKERNMEMYRHLGGIAKAYGTRIGIENMFGWDKRRDIAVPNVCSFAEDLCDYYDTLNDPAAFTVLLDVGHVGMVGQDAQDAIRILGHDRLGALHVHDNNFRTDLHTMPYDYGCGLDWDEITKALGEIDYQGDFTYEADGFQNRFNPENIHIAMKFMEQMGRNLMEKIEAHRSK